MPSVLVGGSNNLPEPVGLYPFLISTPSKYVSPSVSESNGSVFHIVTSSPSPSSSPSVSQLSGSVSRSASRTSSSPSPSVSIGSPNRILSCKSTVVLLPVVFVSCPDVCVEPFCVSREEFDVLTVFSTSTEPSDTVGTSKSLVDVSLSLIK